MVQARRVSPQVSAAEGKSILTRTSIFDLTVCGEGHLFKGPDLRGSLKDKAEHFYTMSVPSNNVMGEFLPPKFIC